MSPSLADSDPLILAEDAYLSGEYEAAVKWYEQALSSHPSDETALIGRLTALGRLSRWDEVASGISIYGSSLTDQPEGAALLAEAYAMTDRPHDALSILDGLSSIPSLDALRIRGEALVALERETEALSLLKEADTGENPDPRISLLIGTILSNQGNVTGALPYLETAFLLLPQDPSAPAALGSTVASLGMYEEALIFSKQAASLNTEDPEIWVTIAYILNRLERYDDALDALDKAIALTPSDSALLNARAYTLYLGGRTEEARTLADEVLRLNPTDPAAMDTLGSIILAGGDPESALQYLKPAADLLAHDPEVLTHLADAYRMLGRNSEAQDLYQRALWIDSSSGRTWRGYSDVLLSLGRYPEAATAIAETFRHYPGDDELIVWEREADEVLKEWYLKNEANMS